MMLLCWDRAGLLRWIICLTEECAALVPFTYDLPSTHTHTLTPHTLTHIHLHTLTTHTLTSTHTYTTHAYTTQMYLHITYIYSLNTNMPKCSHNMCSPTWTQTAHRHTDTHTHTHSHTHTHKDTNLLLIRP